MSTPEATATAASVPVPQTSSVPPQKEEGVIGDNENEGGKDSNKAEEKVEDDRIGVMTSLPPSHILEDGRFIYLPPPSNLERSKFFERSIARHGLLQDDMVGKGENDNDDKAEEKVETKESDKTAPKIHPLEVASARLQANGLAELNRAINLAGLVNQGDYFGLTTIVDPALEAESSKQEARTSEALHHDTVKSTYVLKRKQGQFRKAQIVLERHEKRLQAAIHAQRALDRRLFQLRQQWRLVAPEHGTRARLHAARPTEVVAIDVDVYDRDRVGGGNQALKSNNNNDDTGGRKFTNSNKKPRLAGRLASRVPRFATIELLDDAKVDEMIKAEREEDAKMDTGDNDNETTDASNLGKPKWTRAEPFAVADPTLGRVMENFDPSKVPMLNLQLEIQKSSTGFQETARLEPMTTLSVAQGETSSYARDEELLVTLQHSLFCASLFESIRGELDPDDDDDGSKNQSKTTTVAWLSCESEQNFLPPPSRLVGGDLGKGLASLCLIHCHEGEVKVQLDAEYTLCVKLVEANVEADQDSQPKFSSQATSSGSQSHKQLHALCRALLLHAQDVHHRHSLYLRERAEKKQEEQAKLGDAPRGLARVTKEDKPEKPRILQSCVSLGSKMLFEQRIRKALLRISKWLKSETSEKMAVEWLALSIFDLQSHFTLCFRRLVLDVHIIRDGLTVTSIGEEIGEYRKVKFHSDVEFELFLKMELRRRLRNNKVS